MHDSGAVRVVERLQDAVDVADRIVDGYGARGDDVLQQAPADELHDDVRLSSGIRSGACSICGGRVAGVEHAHDRRMRHARGRLRLETETRTEGRVAGELGVEDLDGDIAAQGEVVASVDLGHPAVTDEVVHAVSLGDDARLR